MMGMKNGERAGIEIGLRNFYIWRNWRLEET
jgi:hypothetical protein